MSNDNGGYIKSEVKYNFGAYGWSMIIYSFLCYFNYVGVTGDGMNLLLTNFSTERGFDFATILALNTPITWVAIVATLIAGYFVEKKGIRAVVTVCYIVVGALILAWVRVTTLPMYILVTTGIFAFTVGYSHLTAAGIVNNWFVKKRSMAFGISSIGLNACTCLFVPMLSFLFGNWGFIKGMTIYGSVLIILGIVSFFWVKNHPQDAGKYIDNDAESDAEVKALEAQNLNVKSGWTFKKCMRTKEVWLLGIIFGLIWLAVMGFVTQIVTFLIGEGFSQTFSIMMMSLAAIVGSVSSWVWGLIDVKIGPRKASVIFCLYFIVPFTLLIVPTNSVTAILAALAFGWTLGGHSTLMPSYTQAIFGRKDFAVPYKYGLTINMVLKSFAFVILSVSLTMVGDYRLAYGFFAVCCVAAALLCLVCRDDKLILPEGKE